MNWLLNPQGKVDTFRAIDWVMELNNLYTKIIFAGTGPNRTVQHILEQSTLIDLFRACHNMIRDSYFIHTRTIHHTIPNMECTFQHLGQEFCRHRPHCYHGRRVAPHSYMDALEKGLNDMVEDPDFFKNALGEDAEEKEREVVWDDLVE